MRPVKLRSEGTDLAADLLLPAGASALLVLAHGAGAGYRHATLLGLSHALAEHGIGTLRFNFPFMQRGARRVDSQPLASAAVRDATRAGAVAAAGLPLYLGGHSFGGRMASHAVLEHALAPAGLVFCSFPLHPAGRPGVGRAAHLTRIDTPMLFASGTRDRLAEATLLSDVVAGLGSRAALHWLDDADHGYRARKRVRRDPRPVLEELAESIARFVATRGQT